MLIKQYKLFLMDEVEFSINDEALDFIVDKANKIRGSWFAMRAVLTDAMYELPSSDDKTLEIDAKKPR
jgi:ATP-dependent Clp protease ATP-binding subunit ClpX